jgi:hypothetical protein
LECGQKLAAVKTETATKPATTSTAPPNAPRGGSR